MTVNQKKRKVTMNLMRCQINLCFLNVCTNKTLIKNQTEEPFSLKAIVVGLLVKLAFTATYSGLDEACGAKLSTLAFESAKYLRLVHDDLTNFL